MSRPCFRRPPLQSGRSIFYDTSPFSSYPVDFKYINRCTCQDLYALTKCEGTYLNIANKTLGGPLHPLRLLDLGDLFVAGPVVSTLAPYTDTLASIVGAPLDLFHLVVGVRLGPLALCAPPHHGQGHHWSLTEVGSPSGAAASTGGSSNRAGDGALFSSSARLPGGGVAIATSSLDGAFASAPSRDGSSVISAVVGATAGHVVGCSVVACPTVV